MPCLPIICLGKSMLALVYYPKLLILIEVDLKASMEGASALLLSDPTSIIPITSPVQICLEPPNSRFMTLLFRKEATLMFLEKRSSRKIPRK